MNPRPDGSRPPCAPASVLPRSRTPVKLLSVPPRKMSNQPPTLNAGTATLA